MTGCACLRVHQASDDGAREVQQDVEAVVRPKEEGDTREQATVLHSKTRNCCVSHAAEPESTKHSSEMLANPPFSHNIQLLQADLG